MDKKIAEAILEKLGARAPESSICPSEVARELWPADQWREHMPEVRRETASLVTQRMVIVTQGESTVNLDETDIEAVRGPIRVRRGPNWH